MCTCRDGVPWDGRNQGRGGPDGPTRAGHVPAAQVFPTLEVTFSVDPVTMQRRFDPETALTLIDPL
jgi:predicted DNA-binding protein with PD1-like motif